MQKFDVQIALEGLREARQKWRDGRLEFERNATKVLNRLLHEAAANYMSREEIASLTGLRPHQVNVAMDKAGLNWRQGKTLLAKTAAEALATNADLLGIAPHEMDLMSPLAYLPMGSELRQALTDKTTSQVHEKFCECEKPNPSGPLNGGVEVCLECGWTIPVSGNQSIAEGVWCKNCEVLEDPEDCPEDYAGCKACGCSPTLDHVSVKVVGA